MRPTTDELLRGLQASLLTHVLPEVQTDFVRTELMLTYALLGIAAGEWDGAAQRLVDDNAAMRSLAARAAAEIDDASLASDLRSLADETDASIRLSELSAANTRLRGAIARLGVALEGDDGRRDLRDAVIEHLRVESEARNHHVLGPRSDG